MTAVRHHLIAPVQQNNTKTQYQQRDPGVEHQSSGNTCVFLMGLGTSEAINCGKKFISEAFKNLAISVFRLDR